MKFYIWLLPLVLISFLNGNVVKKVNIPELHLKAEAAAGQILSQGSRVLSEKYKIYCCGSGVSMPGGIVQKFNLSFTITGHCEKEYLRKTLIECAHDLLQIINSDKEIQPFLIKNPFTIENVQIVYFIYDKNGLNVVDPLITTAQIAHNYLIYRTLDRDNTFNYKNEFTESYEEALKFLENDEIKTKTVVLTLLHQ